MAVIGGGITGLAAAYRIKELAIARETPIEAVVLERGARVGGPLATISRDGFTIETGTDSMLTEKPAAIELARRVGLESEFIPTREEFRKTYVVRKGRLVAIPAGFALLAPVRIGPVLTSPLFSIRGKLRMALEPFIPAGKGSDESLASFVTRRLGREVLDRVAQPLAGGIYTADPNRLSMAATMPRFLEMERRYGSLLRGMQAAEKARAAAAEKKGTSGARWSLFLSFKAGMRALVDTLTDRLGGAVRTEAEVKSIAQSGGQWNIAFSDDAAMTADAIVCALPGYAAASLLKPIEPRLADRLGAISYSSAATVNLAWRESDFPRPLDSFGFVVPAIEKRTIIAGSFLSLKYEHRAPDGWVLARVFLGGRLQTGMMDLSDDEMVAAARSEFRELLNVTAEPAFAVVKRWPDAMPQYEVGHLDRVAEIERIAQSVPGLYLAGAAYRGVGVPDCVRSAEQAAEAVSDRQLAQK
ncbi:MAG TPA: protoporphyrinogen oxidase [Candidatus Binataceae bacterium]|nr:protoporphyrinogen oxidase [Candidatus Binataceae bacterium]